MTNKKKVLIVDDERNIVQMLTMLLETRGYEVLVAENGRDAINRAHEKPDLILLDLILPDIEGLEVCRVLRGGNGTRHIPIIILSIKYLFEDKIEGLYFGADDYLTKPFDCEELFARMEAVLRRRFSLNDYFADKEPAILELRNIINEEKISSVYQPIFYLEPFKLLGCEVLSRPPIKSILSNPDVLFKTALRFGMYSNLEMLAWRRAFEGFPSFPPGTKMFLNCNPYLIESPEFYKIKATFDECNVDTNNIVLEITERSAISDFRVFCERLQFYRNSGIDIAVDDLGGGFASLESIIETKPRYVKIDRHIISDIKRDSLKKSIVKFIVSLCRENRILTIGEGIETKEDLETIIALGVDAGQGYLFCRPAPDIKISDIYIDLYQRLGIKAVTS